MLNGLRIMMAAAMAMTASTAMAQSREEPLCTDRPSRSNNVCTVPEGRIQIESDLINWTRDDADGVRTDVIAYTSPTMKLGIGPATDVQTTFTPYTESRTRDPEGTTRYGGFGDVFVRVKQRLTSENAGLEVGLMPYVKIPTAGRRIGNGAWEGGVSIPIQYALPSGFSLGASPEIDAVLDQDGRGRHAYVVGTLNVGKTITDRLAVGIEAWTGQDLDPSGAERQYSADVFATWLVAPLLQLDAGANFGLNEETPDAQIYVGVSTRF